MKPIPRHPTASVPRRGVAVLWVLFVLTLLSAVIGLTMKDFYANRSFLDQRRKRLQADWLARAGIELAVVQLLAADKTFKSDVTDLVPDSKVHVELDPAPESKTVFVLTSDATYPTTDAHPVTRTQTRTMRRITENGKVRVEIVEALDPKATKK